MQRINELDTLNLITADVEYVHFVRLRSVDFDEIPQCSCWQSRCRVTKDLQILEKGQVDCLIDVYNVLRIIHK